jgi:pimeloyl-ACP methyl ester carboxylesterase
MSVCCDSKVAFTNHNQQPPLPTPHNEPTHQTFFFQTTRMPALPLPGVDLHYETTGSGPLLLCIVGAQGNGSAWHPLARALSSIYTVACYDRRGFSASTITGPQNLSDGERLATDANDAAALIAHLSPNSPATVIGNSSGAIVGLNLLLKHPDRVLKLVCHEPPAFGALPPPQAAFGRQVVEHIYDVYRKSGPIAGMEAFTGGLAVGKEGELMRATMHPSTSHEVRANALFWFEFELRQYPLSKVDIEGLVALKEKFVPAAGVESEVGVAPIACIAGALGKEMLKLPGGHVGFVTDPEAWAKEFLEGVSGY